MRCTTYLVSLILTTGGLFAQSSKLSPEFANVDPASSVRVIVSYNHAPTNSDHQRFLNEGGTHHATFQSITGGNYTVPASSLAMLATDSGITHVSIDHPIAPKLDYITAATNLTSVAGSLSAAQKYGVTGAGIGIALIDSGVNPGSDLAGRLVYSQDFTGGNGKDQYGHGTHVAGIMAGSGSNSHCASCTRSLAGMAPKANIISLRVLDQNGASTDSEVISAIDQAISLKSQ
jgi:serine protease AprX